MRDKLISILNSSFAAFLSWLLMLIFIYMKEPVRPAKYAYLALGDSYTIGEQVPEGDNFPNQTVRMLRANSIAIAAPRIIAQTGWTTDELQDAIIKAAPDSSYDFVTLLIGVNNQYRGRPVDDYTSEFESLLKQAIFFAGNDTSKVAVLSIPDWGATPFAEGRNRAQVAGQIDAYNAANKKIAASYHVHYIDITPGTRLAPADHTLLAPDGLHPSGKEYQIWALALADYMHRILSDKR